MNIQISPSQLHGEITAPASKSCMQRACAASLLAHGTSTILNPGNSNDDLAALDVIQKLGATIANNTDGSVSITSTGVQPVSQQINCGESGLGIRMFTPVAALSRQPITINGTGSLLTRPMHFFNDIFPQLGINIQSNDGRLPINIQGPLVPANIEIDGSLSSQFLTGLLMAFGASVTEPVTITVNDLKSKPYIDLTLQVMASFGRVVSHTSYQQFHFLPQAVNYQPQTYTVEGDWSGAAFLLVAGALAGPITVKGLNLDSTQADKAILHALQDSGCKMAIDTNEIVVAPAALSAFRFDATDCPDLFPPLVALAAYCKGTTVISGVRRLAHKESDRAITLQQEFGKMGLTIHLNDDEMTINGGNGLHAATVHSRHDHRIAMACAVAALRADGPVMIEEAEAINKSYPGFYTDLEFLSEKRKVKSDQF